MVALAAMNGLLKTLTARGLLQDATAGLEERLGRGPVTAYVGLDPTADSLHVGSLDPGVCRQHLSFDR
jgi:tyrosyl-tRNA synthetase